MSEAVTEPAELPRLSSSRENLNPPSRDQGHFIVLEVYGNIRAICWKPEQVDHTPMPDAAVTLLLYDADPNDTTLVVDLGEPVDEFPLGQREAVEHLRTNGRPVLADKLSKMLEEIADDPDEPKLNILSLRDMARLLTKHKEFADPSLSPARGIVHAQWRIDGTGALVWGFLGRDQILVVAQTDRSPDGQALDISDSGPRQEIVKKFGYLVPRN